VHVWVVVNEQGKIKTRLEQDKTRNIYRRQGRTIQDRTITRPDKTNQGKARQDETRQEKTREEQDKKTARQDRTKQDKRKPDQTRPDQTRQHNTTQHNTTTRPIPKISRNKSSSLSMTSLSFVVYTVGLAFCFSCEGKG
jgi:hypothetical protein